MLCMIVVVLILTLPLATSCLRQISSLIFSVLGCRRFGVLRTTTLHGGETGTNTEEAAVEAAVGGAGACWM